MLQDGALVDAARTAGAKLSIWAGTNGFALAGHSAATEYANFQTYIAARLAGGWAADDITVATMLPRNPDVSSPTRATFNASLVGGQATYGYRLARVDLDSRIGVDSANTDTTYYQGDLIHLNDFGASIASGIIYAAMFA